MQKRYQTDTNADGSVNVRGVEAFRLCERGGKKYDAGWWQRAATAFNAEKAQGHLPALAIGHKESATAEQPRIGDLDNMRRVGDTVVVDLTNIQKAEFDANLKTRKYPARSVELDPMSGKIRALSLLGKTPPFHKMPLLAFGEGVETETLYFEEAGDGVLEPSKFQADDELGFLEKVWQHVKGWTIPAEKREGVKKALGEGLSVFQDEINKFSEDEKMTEQERKDLITQVKQEMQADMQKNFDDNFAAQYAEKFEEEFGQKPDEFKTAREADRKAGFTAKVTAFAEEVKKVMAPALVDGYLVPLVEAFGEPEGGAVITFAEKEKGDATALLAGLVGAVKAAAEDGSLLVNFDETGKKGGDEQNSNFHNIDNEDELVKKVEKFRGEKGIETFEEAFDRYQAETTK